MVSIRLLLIVGGLAVAFLGLELVLRIYPDVVNYKIQNLAFSKYDYLPNGMYKRETTIRMNFMKPNFQTRAFLNGYWWKHRTDANGFRNPTDLQSYNIALLGDSFIYGHGLEEEQTVVHFLRSYYNYNAYNMGRQGDCIFNHYVLLRMYMSKLKIKTALVFVFLNDIKDTETYRRKLIKKRPELNTFDYENIHNNLQKLMISDQSFLKKLVFRLHSVRLMYKFIRVLFSEKNRKRVRESRKNKQHKKSSQERVVITNQVNQVYSAGFISKLFAANNDSSKVILAKMTPQKKASSKRGKRKRNRNENVPYFLEPIADAGRFRIVSEYYDAVLEDLSRRCREQGVRLVLINLYLPKVLRQKIYYIASKKVNYLIKSICDRYDIEFFDTREVFLYKKGCYLKHDGHLSEKGHLLLAEFLHKQVLSPKLNPHPN
jgi:hypothetical protein